MTTKTNLPREIVDYVNRTARLWGADAVTAVWVTSSGEVRMALEEDGHRYIADPDEVMTWPTIAHWAL